MKNKKTAIILVGGLGKRLRPITEITPKPLLKIGQSTILEIIVNHLNKNNFNDIIFAARYKSDKFEKEVFKFKKKFKKINFTLSIERKKLGTCGPISLLRKILPKNFLVINGDIISNVNLEKYFKIFSKNKNPLFVFTKKIITPFEFGKLIIKKNKIVSVKEKPNLENLIISGIYFLKKDCLKYIPKNKYYGMDQLIKNFLRKKITVETYVMEKELWIDIGSHNIYKKVKKLKSISKINSKQFN